MRFRDRREAGRELARRLEHLRGTDPVVLALPRGGVPVAAVVAEALDAQLDVVLVRKLGVPGRPELAMGSIGEGEVVVLNDDVIEAARVSGSALEAVRRRELDELGRRRDRYRMGRPPLPLAGRTVIAVDDGIATGATAEAAVQVIAARDPAHLVLAAPVAPPEVVARFERLVDELVVLHSPAAFGAVGVHYDDFGQVTDEEVERALRAAG